MFTVVSGLMIWIVLYSSKRKTKGKLTVWGLFKKFYGDIYDIGNGIGYNNRIAGKCYNRNKAGNINYV